MTIETTALWMIMNEWSVGGLGLGLELEFAWHTRYIYTLLAFAHHGFAVILLCMA